MSKHEQQFRDTLSEILEMDKADLDFGIYRIMNAKREEISNFLDKELIPQVRKVLGDKATDLAQKEDDVFSHLYRFFKRYYDAGDFISKRRYKEGVYAIPYEGEEVKLYWANHDQYYIKSSENLMHYRFTLESGAKVAFRIAEAPQVTDNKKPEGVRRLRLAKEDAATVEEGELVLRFAWELVDKADKKKNEEVAKELAAALLKREPVKKYQRELLEPAPSKSETKDKEKRTLLEKHLIGFISRHAFDYFIHKELGGFLRRELDYYLKTEVMHLDNLNTENEAEANRYLDVLRAIKKVGEKIIALLAQLEDFQKKLWLKKKFVYETQYCFTLDRIPQEFWPEIAANKEQITDWASLGFIEPKQKVNVEFLKGHDKMMIDTQHFDEAFKERLLGAVIDLDGQLDGLLVHGENFQALNLMQERYREQVKCVYIDPPYNSPSSEIAYKNNYKHASWLSLMQNRLAVSKKLSSTDGSHVIAIDKYEHNGLFALSKAEFTDHDVVSVTIEHNKKGTQGDHFSFSNEFAIFAVPAAKSELNIAALPESEWDFSNLRNWGGESLRADAANCFYPIYVKGDEIVGFGEVCKDSFHPMSNVLRRDGICEVYPIDDEGIERKWRYARNTVEGILPYLRVETSRKGNLQIMFAKAFEQYKTTWTGTRYNAGDHGTKVLSSLGFPKGLFDFPKSIHTVRDCIFAVSENSDMILDYFGGSGTTGHAVLNLNREDMLSGANAGNRKYILVEVNDYFDRVIVPRMQKVVFSEKWTNGEPQLVASIKSEYNGISHAFKYIRLESYEDTLNNLDIKGSRELFDKHSAPVPEDYVLHYMLDIETKDSASLLKAGYLKNPFDYQMKITRNNEMAWRKVDLVETFNWLLGLKVKRQHAKVTVHYEFGLSDDRRLVAKEKGSGGSEFTYKLIEGETVAGESILICWRTLSADEKTEQLRKDAAALEKFLAGQKINPSAFDKFYVNGDSTIKGALVIEPHFRQLMFAETEE